MKPLYIDKNYPEKRKGHTLTSFIMQAESGRYRRWMWRDFIQEHAKERGEDIHENGIYCSWHGNGGVRHHGQCNSHGQGAVVNANFKGTGTCLCTVNTEQPRQEVSDTQAEHAEQRSCNAHLSQVFSNILTFTDNCANNNGD